MNTEAEIIAILDGMYMGIQSGVPELDAMSDAIDLIIQEIGYVEKT